MPKICLLINIKSKTTIKDKNKNKSTKLVPKLRSY